MSFSFLMLVIIPKNSEIKIAFDWNNLGFAQQVRDCCLCFEARGGCHWMIWTPLECKLFAKSWPYHSDFSRVLCFLSVSNLGSEIKEVSKDSYSIHKWHWKLVNWDWAWQYIFFYDILDSFQQLVIYLKILERKQSRHASGFVVLKSLAQSRHRGEAQISVTALRLEVFCFIRFWI